MTLTFDSSEARYARFVLWTKILKISTVAPAYMVHECKVFLDIRSIVGWLQLEPAILDYTLLYGQPIYMDLINGRYCTLNASRFDQLMNG